MKNHGFFFQPPPQSGRLSIENKAECNRLEQEIAERERTILDNNDYARRIFGAPLDRFAQISATFLPISGFVTGLVQLVFAYADKDPVPQVPVNSSLSWEISNFRNQLKNLKGDGDDMEDENKPHRLHLV